MPHYLTWPSCKKGKGHSCTGCICGEKINYWVLCENYWALRKITGFSEKLLGYVKITGFWGKLLGSVENDWVLGKITGFWGKLLGSVEKYWALGKKNTGFSGKLLGFVENYCFFCGKLATGFCGKLLGSG